MNKDNAKQIVNEKGDAFELEKADNIRFEPAPNTLLAVPVTKKKKASGLYLPESVGKDSNPTPVARVIAVGENIPDQLKDRKFSLEEGDYIYVDSRYMNFVQIDDIKSLLLMVDAVIGKIPQESMSEKND